MSKSLVTFTGGHPPSATDLNHLNNMTRELETWLATAMFPATYGILYGCVFTDGGGTISWTSGVVVYAGRLYQVTAGSASGTMSTVQFETMTTYVTGNPVTYFDGNTRNVHKIETGTFSASGTKGAASVYDGNRLGVSLEAVINPSWTTVEDVDLLNSWTASTADQKFGYRKIYGNLQLRGKLQGGSGKIYTLPVGYRPVSSRFGFMAALSGGSPAKAFCRVDANGDVYPVIEPVSINSIGLDGFQVVL